MGHTALGHCCLGLIHWHCTAWAEVVEVEVVVEEVGNGHGHSITSCQVRCPNKEGAQFVGRADRGCQVGERRLGQRQGGQRRRGMSIQNVGNEGRWPKVKNKIKIKERGRRGRRITVLIEYTLSQK